MYINNSSQNFYKTSDRVESYALTSNLVTKYTVGNFSTTLQNAAFDVPYFVGSKIITYYPTIIAFGYLSFPNGKILNFGVNKTILRTTTLSLTDSGTSCNAIPTITQIIGSQNLVTDASLLNAVPGDANNLITPMQPFGVSSLLPATCVNSGGTSITCPIGNIFNSGTCHNVVSMLTISFAFENRVITQVSVQAVIRNDLNGNFNQVYRAIFYQSASIPSAVPSLIVKATDQFSGNPGYLDESPVVAGRLSVDGTTITVNPVDFSGRPFIKANFPISWWTVPAFGMCSSSPTSSNLTPVLFKQNMRSHCLLSILNSFADTAGACANLDANIKQILNSGTGQINRISKFGTISTKNLADWLAVSIVDETRNIRQTKRRCENVTIGQRIIIPYAYTGVISAPQAKIKGVQIKLVKGNIEFKCGGPFCAPNNNDLTQNFPIFTAVDFVDQTKTIASNSDINYDSRLPNNVFFPFAGNYGHDSQVNSVFETS
ncbi:Tectonic-1 [Cichlidogyrus casuarinus]|uniref:Tectonic-1 n=1 Tax=Cichlidogyrus casuarinus TaxID=1844966 RepID=A0ABD2QEW0_9PLAT